MQSGRWGNCASFKWPWTGEWTRMKNLDDFKGMLAEPDNS
jgi:hypothetical protein